MIVIGLSFIICHLSFSPARAQTFTQRLQKTVQGEGTVTLHHDKSIDALVNGQTTTPTAKPATPKKQDTPTKPKEEKKPSAQQQKQQQQQQQQENHEQAQNDSTTTEKAVVRTYKTTGFRVQVFAGGNSRKDRRKAEQTGNELRALFPNEQVYSHFYSPRWICRIGNYRTYEEAHKMLQEVRELGYSSATIVKGTITVPY